LLSWPKVGVNFGGFGAVMALGAFQFACEGHGLTELATIAVEPVHEVAKQISHGIFQVAAGGILKGGNGFLRPLGAVIF
jgi:hypothetical protein